MLFIHLNNSFPTITDSFSEEEDEFIMAEENNHAADDDIDQEDIRNLHIDGKTRLDLSIFPLETVAVEDEIKCFR